MLSAKVQLIVVIDGVICIYYRMNSKKDQSSSRKHMKYSWLRLVFIIFFFPKVECFASPIPGMGSSNLVSPSKGYNFNLRGFRLTKGQTNWGLQAATATNQNSTEEASFKRGKEISVRFQSPISNGFLAVKTETLATPITVEFYAKKWIRDYSYYGFDVLGAKSFSQGNARGYVIDLYHSKKLKQMRQVVFLREKTAVILTCTDEKKQYQLTLSNCNNITKTFSWL